jgi:DNA-binding transcriptional ArsR family regulator
MASGKRSKSADPAPLPVEREKLRAAARMFAVLADENRLAILVLLRPGPQTVSAVVDRLPLGQAAVSKHLSALHRASFLARERRGNHVRYWIAEPMIFDLFESVCAKLQRDATKMAETMK